MSGYVEVEFHNGIEAAFKGAFDDAAEFWNEVVTSGQPGTSITQTTSLRPCGLEFNLESGDFIPGLRIYSTVAPIDGVNGILGQAGPCLLAGNFPMVGIMQFDSADSQGLLDDGQFGQVIIHEMGHVVGIGGLWTFLGFVDDPCRGNSGICRGDPSYNQPGGQAGFQALGGGSDERLLVGDERGPGTWNAHWREETFVNELMTGFLDQAMPNPLSIMSVRSLEDLGYGVNIAAAESYNIPSEFQRPFNAEKLELFGDILDLEMVDINDASLRVEELGSDDSLTNEIGGLFSLMLIGFVAMAGLMYYFNGKQRKALENILAEASHGKAPQELGTKNKMYIEP